VDGVLSFEWMHPEISRLGLKEQKCAPWMAEYSFSSMLAVFLKVKLRRCRLVTNKAIALVDFLCDETLLNGEVKACMIEKVRKHVRSHVFTPGNILKSHGSGWV
jgi:hypothetical protein